MRGWLRFAAIQLLAGVGTAIGWVLLAPLAAFRLWYTVESPQYTGRAVTRWRGGWLTYLWGNDEDGVTGAPFYAERVKNERLRAYLWSAWRNSFNNFRWRTAVIGGPFRRWYWVRPNHIWVFQAGYRPDNGWPVLRLVRIK